MAAGDTPLGQMILDHLARLDQSPAWLARKANVAPSTITRYINGDSRPRNPASVAELADAMGIYDQNGKRALLEAAGFLYVEGQPPANTFAAASITSSEDAAGKHEQGVAEKSLRQELYEQPSAEEKFLVLLRAGTDRITPPGLLRLLLLLGTAWLACRLTFPLLLWPTQAEAHRVAAFQFGVATLLIPLLLAMIVPAQPQVGAATHTTRTAVTVLLLRLAGALAGFYIAACLAIGFCLAALSLRGVPLSETAVGLMVLLALAFGYWGALIIPLNRWRMYDQPRLHPTDRIVLPAFVLAGPLSAVFLHLNRELLLDQGFLVVLFVALAGWLLWETRNQAQQPSFLVDIAVVALWGGVLPCTLLFLPLLLPGKLSTHEVYIGDVAILAGFLVGQMTLLAVLYVRRKANLFWPLLVWILGAELLWLVVLICRPQLAPHFLAGLAALLFAIWFLGRGRLQKYLWIHSSFWIMQVLFILALAAWVMVWGWPSVFVFLMLAIALIAWAALTDRTDRPLQAPQS